MLVNHHKVKWAVSLVIADGHAYLLPEQMGVGGKLAHYTAPEGRYT